MIEEIEYFNLLSYIEETCKEIVSLYPVKLYDLYFFLDDVLETDHFTKDNAYAIECLFWINNVFNYDCEKLLIDFSFNTDIDIFPNNVDITSFLNDSLNFSHHILTNT
uniref:Uncharacterized protein n=1 Tax=viral metagenome TaxID=1070528 RepID=A0A6C0JSA0_9ZZZZ